jgi:peptide-methionine (S)-S-oxide reductase
MKKEFATFGAGCFWGVQVTFDEIKGVLKTEVGYMGGKMKNPTYNDVCTDETGHAEVVHIEFDKDVLPYDKLLDVFWVNHDPTQKNRQGPDEGTQYRSVIFYYNEAQKKAAVASKAKWQKQLGKPIATQIVPAETFYKAEDHHQKYLQKQGKNVCH